MLKTQSDVTLSSSNMNKIKFILLLLPFLLVFIVLVAISNPNKITCNLLKNVESCYGVDLWVEVQYVPGEFEVYIPQIDDSMTIGLDINFENDEWIYHNASFKAKGKILYPPSACELIESFDKPISCISDTLYFKVDDIKDLKVTEDDYDINIEYETSSEVGIYRYTITNNRLTKTQLDYNSDFIKQNCPESDSFYFSTSPCWYGYTEDDLLETTRIIKKDYLDELHKLLLDEKYLEFEDVYGVTSELERYYTHTYKICIDDKCKTIVYYETVDSEKPEILKSIDLILVNY